MVIMSGLSSQLWSIVPARHHTHHGRLCVVVCWRTPAEPPSCCWEAVNVVEAGVDSRLEEARAERQDIRASLAGFVLANSARQSLAGFVLANSARHADHSM